MKIRFHLIGPGTVLLDDIQLFDLKFDNNKRGTLAKRIYAARTALEDGKIVDCQRLLDGYWAKYLQAHVPPKVSAPSAIARQTPSEAPATESTPEEQEPGFTDRIRGWVPGIWR